jgi:hypothetical protein
VVVVVALLVVFESDALAFNQLLEAFAERISEDSSWKPLDLSSKKFSSMV